MNTAQTKTLKLRLQAQQEELKTCTTAAMTRCVEQAIADTKRQLEEK